MTTPDHTHGNRQHDLGYHTARAGKTPASCGDSLLSPHLSGQRAKKFRGRMVEFSPGPITRRSSRTISTGRRPVRWACPVGWTEGGRRVRDLLNRFLTAKQSLPDSGEILRTSLDEYHSIFPWIGDTFGLWRAIEDRVEPGRFTARRAGGRIVGHGARPRLRFRCSRAPLVATGRRNRRKAKDGQARRSNITP